MNPRKTEGGKPAAQVPALFAKLKKQCGRCEGRFGDFLPTARDTGNTILRLEALTDLRGPELYNQFRASTGSHCADRTLQGYRKLASGWSGLEARCAGNPEMTYTEALDMLRQPRCKPPTVRPATPVHLPPAMPPQPEWHEGQTLADALRQVIAYLEMIDRELGDIGDVDINEKDEVAALLTLIRELCNLIGIHSGIEKEGT